MPFVQAKCTNCGATLCVDNSKEAAICEFCGSAYIVEKAVNNYNTINNNRVYANVVNIYENASHTNSSDFEITAGVLKKYTGSSTEVVVPGNVYEIGAYAFYGMSLLTKVHLPASVSTIGRSAFYCCTNLSVIDIPSSVTDIDDYAFGHCTRLAQVRIANGVKHIRKSAFDHCQSLTSIIIPDSVLTLEQPFSGCSALRDIKFPSRFGASAFVGSVWFEVWQRERQQSIDDGFCPDHKLKLSLFKKKCPKCGEWYRRSY